MEFASPHGIVASIVSTYWLSVMVMSIRSRIKFRTASGSLPKTRLERLMWLVWVPTIFCWVGFSWGTDNVFLGAIADGQAAMSVGPYKIVVWIFALVSIVAFLLTVCCWLRMGKNWSMAVRPEKETELITDGLFSAVRHPIYSLSLLLMLCTVVVIFNWTMLLIGTIHCSMLVLKAWNEEKYLIGVHGLSLIHI